MGGETTTGVGFSFKRGSTIGTFCIIRVETGK